MNHLKKYNENGNGDKPKISLILKVLNDRGYDLTIGATQGHDGRITIYSKSRSIFDTNNNNLGLTNILIFLSGLLIGTTL